MWMMVWDGYARRSWHILGYYTNTCLDEMRKDTSSLSQDNWLQDQKLSSGVLEN